MNRIMFKYQNASSLWLAEGFRTNKDKNTVKGMEVRSHLNKSLFECYQTPLHVIPETRKKQMCLRGGGELTCPRLG